MQHADPASGVGKTAALRVVLEDNQRVLGQYRVRPEADDRVLKAAQRQLVEYLRARLASTKDPEQQVRRWIDGVMAQARDPRAADATRPFALNGARLADRFPDDLAASRTELLATLSPSVQALGGARDDAGLVCELVLARMNDAIAHRRRPHQKEVEHLVGFCLAGISRQEPARSRQES